MLIDGNNMIELLSLPEWDERVVAMLEEFGEERPVYNPEQSYVFITLKDYGLEMMFETDALTPKQKENEGQGNLYLNQISLSNKTTIKLPFDLEIGDDYDTVVKKLGKDANYENSDTKELLYWLLDDGEKKYFINVNFEDASYEKLKNIFLDPYSEDIEYFGCIAFNK
ncbi:hypothetical protein [Sulfurimonas sp.]|uniref:hypothetical protein n=1 Tax=Sulfurimonas sp. TaxID=2022749 RepID=UPI003D108409